MIKVFDHRITLTLLRIVEDLDKLLFMSYNIYHGRNESQ